MYLNWICLFLLIPSVSIAASSEAFRRLDTVFVDLVRFSHPVFSVESGSDSSIYLVTSKGIMKAEGDEFDIVLPGYVGPIAFERSGDEEWPVPSPCSDWERFHPFQEWSRFFNQERLRVSVAQSKDGLHWVCDGNRLYIYDLIPSLDQFVEGISTRGIVVWHGALWINTYQGLYRNGQVIEDLNIARSGPLVLHRDTLYTIGEESFIMHGKNERIDTLLATDETQKIFSAVAHADKLWASVNQIVGVIDVAGFNEVWAPGLDMNLIDVNGELWALPREDFGAYRLEIGKFAKIPFQESRINDVIKVDDGYYLATEKGVVKWNLRENSFVTMDIADGLPSNSICGLFLASDGDLWASTLGGLCRLDWTKGLVETHLPFTEFNYFSKLSLPGTDSCYFGSMDGVFLLDASEFSPIKAQILKSNDEEETAWYRFFTAVLAVSFVFAVWVGGRSERKRRKVQNEVQGWIEKGKELERQAFRKDLENVILTGLPGVSVDSCAEALGMSSRNLLNRCIEELGERPSVVLREVKLAAAKKQLELYPDSSLSEIAKRVGYSTRYLRELLEKSN